MKLFKRRIYYGWWVVGAAAGAQFGNAATAINILTIFVLPMSTEFGWSRTGVAAATSLGAILGAIVAPFSGRLIDRIGSRVILTLGSLLVVCACLGLATVGSLIGFYVAFTIARSAEQGLVQVGAAPVVAKWFFKYRGRAMSLIFFASSAGMIITAPLVQLIISNFGWRLAWVMLAGNMFLIGVVPCALLIRRQPEDLGLMLDGAGEDYTGVESDTISTDTIWSMHDAVGTYSFWAVLGSLFIAAICTSGVGLHLIPYLVQQNISSGAAVSVISVMAFSGAIAAIVLGWVSEKISPRIMLGAVYLLSAISLVVLLNTTTLPLAYTFAILNGIVGTGVNTLAPILWARFYGRGIMGSIYGISRSTQVVGFAIGPLASGLVYDSFGSYENALIWFAVLSLVSVGFIASARRPRIRNLV
ncbi:MAG: hypothetical protein CL886_03525 [Dehalococcoidia bacterium]|nr:hypothetical protein [Dehalococcoidia bacterium]